MPDLSSCATALSNALSGMSWKFPLGLPATSTPRISKCFQPSSLVAAIWASIVLPASSPIPVRIIKLAVERFSKVLAGNLRHFLFVFRSRDQLFEFFLEGPAAHGQLNRLVHQGRIEHHVGEFN